MAGLNKTPGANRLHIGFFGKRNSGKSALINAFVNQEVSIVSSEPGTTTDPVYKAMEIDGLGPCLLVDTAGFDDIGTLGQLRNDKTKKASEKIDIAIILFNDRKICQELDWYHYFKEKHIPTILVISKADLQRNDNLLKKITEATSETPLLISSLTKQGIKELQEKLLEKVPADFEKESITGELAKKGDLVLLVMPQDIQAPKGRLILPQVQVMRELLDKGCQIMAVTTEQLKSALQKLNQAPDLVITDSQVFKYVYENMVKNGHCIGGEQSGHIIFSKHATTGDGILTSLKVMEAVIESKRTIAQLIEPVTIYPQLMKNVPVRDKKEAQEDPDVRAVIAEVETDLGENGRVLVRESGTEPVVRVMVEADTDEKCLINVNKIVDKMKEKGFVIKR